MPQTKVVIQEKPLFLNLYREHFARIIAGKKLTEFRDLTPYWRRRLMCRRHKLIRFRNGYGLQKPEMLVECLGIREVPDQGHFAILLGRIIEIKRWQSS